MLGSSKPKHREPVIRKIYAQIIMLSAGALIASSAPAGHHQDAANLLKENFLASDRDGSGDLDGKEFADFVSANSEADLGPFPMIHVNNMQDRAFSRLDANKDEVI